MERRRGFFFSQWVNVALQPNAQLSSQQLSNLRLQDHRQWRNRQYGRLLDCLERVADLDEDSVSIRICCYCKSGRHRSVAFAHILESILVRTLRDSMNNRAILVHETRHMSSAWSVSE
jgi:RNase adaptor protein for sRNA GlmZ degradation